MPSSLSRFPTRRSCQDTIIDCSAIYAVFFRSSMRILVLLECLRYIHTDLLQGSVVITGQIINAAAHDFHVFRGAHHIHLEPGHESLSTTHRSNRLCPAVRLCLSLCRCRLPRPSRSYRIRWHFPSNTINYFLELDLFYIPDRHPSPPSTTTFPILSSCSTRTNSPVYLEGPTSLVTPSVSGDLQKLDFVSNSLISIRFLAPMLFLSLSCLKR